MPQQVDALNHTPPQPPPPDPIESSAWPCSERPRERLARLGAEALSAEELLVLLLGTAARPATAAPRVISGPPLDARKTPLRPAVRLLAERVLGSGADLGALSRRDLWAWRGVEGLGGAAAARLVAAFELGRRSLAEGAVPGSRLLGPGDVERIFGAQMAALPLEQLLVILLDSRHTVVGTQRLYQGSVNSTPVRVGELFAAAISARCPAVVFVHNHPSGDPEPSVDDWSLTRAAVEAGRLLDIEVLDHMVVGRLGYVSLNQRRPHWFVAGRRGPGSATPGYPQARRRAASPPRTGKAA